jgi:aspartate/methionine/tyrosine aminotransferase
MEYLKYGDIARMNKEGINGTVETALSRLEAARKSYPSVILEAVKNGALARQIDLTQHEASKDLQACRDNPLSSAAGAYFLNENIIGGSRENEALAGVNNAGNRLISDWRTDGQKLKLGPGVGFIEAPSLYRRLITMGLEDPTLTVNYTAPFGTSTARKGIKEIMDSRIDPEGDFFPDTGVFITQGATEGVDLFMEGLAKINPGTRVVFLGLSYYTGPFSAVQKGLTVDRLLASPISINGNTRFFPDAKEIEKSLPADTKALIITAPNNPNGETYNDQELTRIVKLAKERNFLILFDCIFENMYFDETENYRSRLLQIATIEGSLDRIVVVDSLSKTKNFPGERVGFVATTDAAMTDALTNIVLSRRCNPQLTLGPLLAFEGLARKTKALVLQSPSTPLNRIAAYAMEDGDYPFNKESFTKMYDEWDQWNTETLRYYADNLRLVKTVLEGSISGSSPDKAAFNTFVRTLGPGTNSMDYLAKLMFTMATYTQVGPCFGISQKVWDQQLGIWPRITYACGRDDLIEGLTRLVVFTRFYAERNFGDPNKFPVLNITYDNQI